MLTNAFPRIFEKDTPIQTPLCSRRKFDPTGGKAVYVVSLRTLRKSYATQFLLVFRGAKFKSENNLKTTLRLLKKIQIVVSPPAMPQFS